MTFHRARGVACLGQKEPYNRQVGASGQETSVQIFGVIEEWKCGCSDECRPILVHFFSDYHVQGDLALAIEDKSASMPAAKT